MSISDLYTKPDKKVILACLKISKKYSAPLSSSDDLVAILTHDFGFWYTKHLLFFDFCALTYW